MHIVLPDASIKVLADNATGLDLAASIGPRLAKDALAVKVNGVLRDLNAPLSDNATVEIVTFESAEGKSVFWHTSSHILAQAVQELFPSAKLAIGPAIENGFYYDFDVDHPFTTQDLLAIEEKCKNIAGAKIPLQRIECRVEEARGYFTEKKEPYKVELLGDIEGAPSMYRQGAWQDLCRGPHLPNTGYVRALKLLNVAGAYWRGSDKNKMLQRIYGISFPKQAMLDEHVRLLEEAQKRDHRKLGRELDLFSFHNEGAGFPFWHGNGMVLYNTVMDYSRARHVAAGYQEVKTPMILNEELWHRSGHWDKYRENMYFTTIDEIVHAVKPMNCPGGLLIYKNSPHSYKEFPLKYCEFGLVHRHEKAGVLQGLFRVRQFTQDDAHIFCLPEQIEPQLMDVIDFIMSMYRTFGFSGFAMELSTRPDKFMGAPELWDKAEAALKNVLDAKKLPYKINPGDGAFYGPKIDFHIKDCLNRSWQCGTVQLDFQMPERFELEYTAETGEKKRPVMIHRALFGSMERFIGILLEHYGGALPLWLAPQQVSIIPISEKFAEYATGVYHQCIAAGLRAHIDARPEKMGYKIREAEIKKIPCMAVVGEKEAASNSVSLRYHGRGDCGALPVEEFIKQLVSEVKAQGVAPAS
ncbi:MAG TPA: threonine--tRNA ligase [Chitinivibrionales bacterium]